MGTVTMARSQPAVSSAARSQSPTSSTRTWCPLRASTPAYREPMRPWPPTSSTVRGAAGRLGERAGGLAGPRCAHHHAQEILGPLGIQAAPGRRGPEGGDLRLLPRRIEDGQALALLGGQHLGQQGAALGQQVEDARVDGVDAGPGPGQGIVHGIGHARRSVAFGAKGRLRGMVAPKGRRVMAGRPGRGPGRPSRRARKLRPRPSASTPSRPCRRGPRPPAGRARPGASRPAWPRRPWSCARAGRPAPAGSARRSCGPPAG